jgi:hypothetical protein
MALSQLTSSGKIRAITVLLVVATAVNPSPSVATATATLPMSPARTESLTTTPRTAHVHKYKLPRWLVARREAGKGSVTRYLAVARPRPVAGYGIVGVTWRGAVAPGLRIALRTRIGDAPWTRWQALQGVGCPTKQCGSALAAVHGPDKGTPERDAARPGTDAMAIGRVDEVQVRLTGPAKRVPRDLTLSVVDPGKAVIHTRQASTRGPRSVPFGSAIPPRPEIRTRAQWGADEGMRSNEPSYGQVRAGFVHHTVNANVYRRRDVPAIIRGIYAYHTQSRGWNDIGYNFLVDRFGRIWEGRYGGVTRAVIGAHTYGYNDVAFAMSAIGDFDKARPPRAVLDAYARLFAWKLAIHGVAIPSRRDLGDRVFPAISAHRDAGNTACPGKYLYARMRAIRIRAALVQSGRDLGKSVVR